MREFLVKSGIPILCLICLIEIVFATAHIVKSIKSKSMLSVCILLLDICLFIDAFLLILGSVLHGKIPVEVSRIRYILHGILTPFILPVCGYSLKFKRRNMNILWIVTAAFSILGLINALSIILVPSRTGDIFNHIQSSTSPSWTEIAELIISYGTMIPLIISGIIVVLKEKKPWLLFAGLALLIFTIIGPLTDNSDLVFLIGMIGEVFLVVFFIIHEHSVDNDERIKKEIVPKEKE